MIQLPVSKTRAWHMVRVPAQPFLSHALASCSHPPASWLISILSSCSRLSIDTDSPLHNSEQMGSTADLRCIQSCCRGLLHYLLFSIPSPSTQASQVCHLVSIPCSLLLELLAAYARALQATRTYARHSRSAYHTTFQSKGVMRLELQNCANAPPPEEMFRSLSGLCFTCPPFPAYV